MPSVARLGDLTLGIPNHPIIPAITSSPDVMANGKGVVVVGSLYDPHSKPNPPNSLVTGSPSIMVNGKAVGRTGDLVSCGDLVAAGSPDVLGN